MRALIATALIVAFVAGVGSASADPSALAAKLTAQPGVEITHRTEGNAVTTEWKRNGVVIWQTQDGSKVTTYASDTTKEGAVLCSWMVDVSIRSLLQACPAEGDAELRADLDQAIGKIDTFIIANSIEPVTIEALHAREAANAAYTLKQNDVKAGQGSQTCSAGDALMMIKAVEKMPHAERLKRTDDLLSMPRWPVTDPCL